ncbi:nucleotide modification associated domain-containing protein [Priestia endophytica]|uniref:nucleotide modification associated domain-containing protein n=1 Tax=Priestia endophytica TaxID=135735 RepID=UPI003D2E559A
MSFDKAVENIGYSVVATVKKKNKDYGNSYEKMIDKYGMVALLIRFQDKLGRLDSLVLKGQEQEVPDESIEDTLKDIAGYALLELTRREMKKKKGINISLPSSMPQVSNVVPHATVENSITLGKGSKHEDLYF